jgi:HrpA-like RNA helicase
MMIVPLYGT